MSSRRRFEKLHYSNHNVKELATNPHWKSDLLTDCYVVKLRFRSMPPISFVLAKCPHTIRPPEIHGKPESGMNLISVRPTQGCVQSVFSQAKLKGWQSFC